MILTSTMEVVTIAGSYPTAASGLIDGIGTFARFYGPAGICVNGRGDIYVADCNNYVISKISILQTPSVQPSR